MKFVHLCIQCDNRQQVFRLCQHFCKLLDCTENLGNTYLAAKTSGIIGIKSSETKRTLHKILLPKHFKIHNQNVSEDYFTAFTMHFYLDKANDAIYISHDRHKTLSAFGAV